MCHSIRHRGGSVVLLLALVLAAPAVARADYAQLLHRFAGGVSDGADPGNAKLVQASDGFFYGVTRSGGVNDGGTFFRIGGDGTAFTVLYSFEAAARPSWIIQVADGTFYGVQRGGGANGHGRLFSVTTAGVLTPLYDADVFASGFEPISILEATDGNFYGLMASGGLAFAGRANGGGGVFKLTPAGIYSLLFTFTSSTPNGPVGYLIQAADGNLYGNTSKSSNNAFRLTLAGQLTAFNAAAATSALEQGPDTAFYAVGGYAGWPSGPCGRVDRLTLSTRQFVHVFDCVNDYGGATAAPVPGQDGLLYGTTANSLYKMTTGGSYTVIAPLPEGPAGPLTQATDGRWYGMTGTMLFRLMPAATTPPIGFDNDAAADLPLYDATTGTWRILTSSSGYRSSLQIFWGGPDYTPVPADYDGDGRLDVAVYHAGRGTWYVLTSSSNFTSVMMKTLGGAGASPVPGDFDGDHRADFAVMRAGVLTFVGSSTSTSRSITVGTIGDVPVRGDFDGDGAADAAVYRPATGAWRILTSSSNFTTLVTKTLGGPGFAALTGDYDGDHKADAAFYDVATGDWTIQESSTNTIVTIGWGGTGYAPVPGDYDGDGKSDLAVYSAAAGEWYVLLSSTGFTGVHREVWGTPIESPVTTLPVRTTWTDALRATDFDGDGTSDIVVYEPSTGVWSILTSSSHFTQTRTITWGGTYGDVPVPGDYDGDGIADPAVFNPASGTFEILRSSLGGLTVPLGTWGDIPVPRDFDGDGLTDPAVYTPWTGAWRFAPSTWSRSFTNLRTVTYGAAWLTPVPADYDGDGLVDLGVYDRYTGRWQALLAKSNYTTPPLTMAWGGGLYTPLPADFDGDGKADFGVCVKSTGNWYVLESGFTYTTAFGLAWGAAIDTPLAADYDGDGISDMASYDSTTGEWYVLLSSSGYTLPLERTLGGPGYVPAR